MNRRTNRPPTWKMIAARFASRCAACGAGIDVGDSVAWKRGEKARCSACGIPQELTSGPITGADIDEERKLVRWEMAEDAADYQGQNDCVVGGEPTPRQRVLEAIDAASEEVEKVASAYYNATLGDADAGATQARRVLDALRSAVKAGPALDDRAARTIEAGIRSAVRLCSWVER